MTRKGLDFGRFCCFDFVCVCFVAGFGFVCLFLVWWEGFWFFFKARTLKEGLSLKYRYDLKQVFYA